MSISTRLYEVRPSSFYGVFEQCGTTKDPVREFTVRQYHKQAHDEAEVNGGPQGHGRRRAALRMAARAVGHVRARFPMCYGSEFISRDLDLWAYANNVSLDFSRPGKATDNGFIEAFNSKLRAECVNAHWFLPHADSREKLEPWRRYYNEERPHKAIEYNVPTALHNPGGATSQPS